MFLLFFLFLLVLSFLIKMKILLLGLFVSYIRINAPIVVVVGKETGLLLSADNTRTKGDCERLHINNPLHVLQHNKTKKHCFTCFTTQQN